MFTQTWSHDILRKYVIIFGTLFNNIFVPRTNNSGQNVQTLKVPLSYGPKDKFLARIEGDPDLDKSTAITLPRMGFEIINVIYAPDRKLNTLNKKWKSDTAGASQYVYQEVPYDIIFNLYVMVKNATDGTRIIEQIIPNFTPEWTVTANILPDIGKTYDVPIIMNDVSIQDIYEGGWSTRRSLVWILTFTMKGVFFGPIRSTKLIKFADVGFKVVDDPQSPDATIPDSLTVTAQPGQLANGSPTSNIDLTVAYADIAANSDYSFINQYEEGSD